MEKKQVQGADIVPIGVHGLQLLPPASGSANPGDTQVIEFLSSTGETWVQRLATNSGSAHTTRYNHTNQYMGVINFSLPNKLCYILKNHFKNKSGFSIPGLCFFFLKNTLNISVYHLPNVSQHTF